MRTKLLTAASVAALGLFAFTPAMAQPGVGGYVDGGYANTTISGGGPHLNDWRLSGSAAAALGGSSFTVQGDGSYDSLHVPGETLNGSQLNLSLIWNAPMGKIGATVGRDSFGFIGPESLDGTTYGGFGVLYPNQQWTVGIKGGSLNFGSGIPNSTYYGGEIVGYPTPDIALGLNGDHAHVDLFGGANVDTWGLNGEWQPTANPWTVKLGYDNSKFGSARLNTWSLNFRWYFGGGSTLVSHHRDGAEPWGTRQTALRFLF
jgi:hypothetical protein